MSFSAVYRVVATGALTIGLMVAQPAPAPPPPGSPAPPPPARGYVYWSSSMPASYIGIGFQEVDADRAKALNLGEARGVVLTRVESESPAGKAGLKAGDVILEYNGQRVDDQDSFMRFVKETPPHREVKLLIHRGGSTQTVSLVTADRKKLARKEGEPGRVEIPVPPAPEITAPDMPRATMSWRSGMLGVEAEGIDGPFAEFFGVKEGVLVRNVGKDTPAEKAGLKPGDVITKIDETAVTTPRQITSKLRSAGEKKTFSVTLTREKREMTMPVTVEGPAEGKPKAKSVNQ